MVRLVLNDFSKYWLEIQLWVFVLPFSFAITLFFPFFCVFRLRDELRNLPCTSKCRHDAAADLIHIYAYTKCFYKIRVSYASMSKHIVPAQIVVATKFFFS